MPTTSLNPDRSPTTTVDASRGGHATSVDINLGGLTLIVVVLMAAVIGATGVVMGMDIADRSAVAREQRQRIDTYERAERDRLAAFERAEEARTTILHDAMQDLQRQYRMVELKLDDWTVVAHRKGLQLPGDYTRGPQGNLDRESFEFVPKPTRKGK